MEARGWYVRLCAHELRIGIQETLGNVENDSVFLNQAFARVSPPTPGLGNSQALRDEHLARQLQVTLAL